MSEELAGSQWLRRVSIKGGWAVFCRLCGNDSKRTFHASMTNYVEAERASRKYAHEHIATEGHQVALRAYQAGEVDETLAEGERLLHQLFGVKPRSEAEIRRLSARREARRAEAQQKVARERERHRQLRETQPKCAICGLPVSTSPDRQDDRLTLPSGAMVHARCVS